MWYRAFGWPESPFSIRPSPHVVGLEDVKEALLQDLLSGSPALVVGPPGMGKTSLLLWLKMKLRDTPFIPAYLNLHALLAPQERWLQARLRLPFLIRRLRLSPGAILLVDESHGLQPQAAEWIKAMFDQGLLYSLVLAAPEEPPLPPPLRARLGPHIYRLQELSLPERIALLKHRMNGKNPFTEEALILLAKAAGPSPRALLQTAELVCKRLSFKAELGEPITPADLQLFLPARQSATYKDASPTPQPSSPLPNNRDNNATTKETLSHPASFAPTCETGRPSETSTTEPGENSSEISSHSLSPMQRELLRVLSHGPRDVKELSELLGSSPGSVRRQISRLRQPGRGLPPLVQDVPGSSPKRFSLTSHGEKILNQKG